VRDELIDSMSNFEVYLDIDGVLGDFWGMVAKMLGRPGVIPTMDDRDHRKEIYGMDLDDMWGMIDEMGPAFWSEMELYPWTHDLVDIASKIGSMCILSSPSEHPSSAAGKVEWMSKHFGPKYGNERGAFRDFILTTHKERCINHRGHSILIDDRKPVCAKYREAGGTAILFPQPWNSKEPERERAELFESLNSMISTSDSV